MLLIVHVKTDRIKREKILNWKGEEIELIVGGEIAAPPEDAPRDATTSPSTSSRCGSGKTLNG
jgi:hypothetical protein